MQFAISTGSLNRDTTTALARAAALGFSHVEINVFPEELGYGYRRKTNARFYRQLAQQVDALQLRVWSVTAPRLTQEQMFFERARADILLSATLAAGILGASVYAVHPADIFTSEIAFESYMREQKAPPVIEGYDEAWVQAVNRRITMALRNHDHWLGAPLTNQVERMAKVSEDLAVGWALDVRRALKRNKLGAWLEAAGNRLAVAYLYDLDENGKVPPLDPAWHALLPPLLATNLKCLVIDAPAADEDEITRSHEFLQEIVRDHA